MENAYLLDDFMAFCDFLERARALRAGMGSAVARFPSLRNYLNAFSRAPRRRRRRRARDTEAVEV